MTRLNWSEDVGAGQWIVERLHEFGTDVGSLVPDCYASYARILHPAWREGSLDRVTIRWSDLAETAGLTLRAETQFEDLHVDESIEAPARGRMPRDDVDVLVDILSSHTETPADCWFGVWDGYGWMTGGPSIAWLLGSSVEAPELAVRDDEPPSSRLTSAYRSYGLYRGAVAAAGALGSVSAEQSPNLWWPADRAWCVASEVDLDSTFVGGSSRLIASILAEERLEALQVSVDCPITGRRGSTRSD